MFCRFCGKELEENAAFCGNCGAPVGNKTAEKSEKVAEPFFAEEKPLPAVNPRMEGFGKALTGTILSFVGMVFFFIACALIAGAETYEYDYYYGYSYSYVYEEDLIASLFFVIGAIVLGIISVVFGAKSIATFKRTQGQKPIATLILGIVSLAEGACCLLCNAIIFFPLIILLAEI
ncbi:MAG: zinc ribbon domain-containing protein [Clostridia bacterium]|nr:zinc ribbon domain-containing protein [Clostridia bacterium]